MEEVDEGPTTVIKGQMNGMDVRDVLVDTGAARIMVHRSLFADEKLVVEGGHVPIQCAYGDLVDYPVARVTVTVRGSPTHCLQ